MDRSVDRRKFLRQSALSACSVLTILTSRRTRAQAPARSGAHLVNVAFIGVGGRGADNLRECFAAGCNVVALCDVDAASLAVAARQHPHAKTYADYRIMLERQKDIEAVVVATPDHHHFPASLMAIELGKHVYCEKPLTHTVWEARELARAAVRKGLATQMGTQGHASEGIRLLVEWIRAGVIGQVREVHIWTDRPAGWWPQGIVRPDGQDPVPPDLDWDLWIGPAPARPFKASTYHPFKWRGWWDFGTGALGDIGCHALDWPWWALDLTAPVAVAAETFGGNDQTGPLWSNVVYEFPASGSRPALKLFWYDGRNRNTPRKAREWREMAMLHELAELGDRQLPENGQLYVGENGKILVSGSPASPRLIPESRMKDFSRPERTLARSPGHHAEWLSACRGGKPAGSNFGYAGPLAEAVLVGNLAVRLDQRIEWDSANLKAVNAPQADALIRRQYRKGWEI